jgi:hypothetical protein
MKKRNTILSITSVLLIVLFMAGSTGAVIVKHTCVSCGFSDFHTEVFSSVHSLHSCDCKNEKSSCHDENEEALHPGCCTFTSEKLSLTEYNNSKFISLSAVILPVLSFSYKNNGEQQEKHTFITEFHNKHGGRDILQSSCRLII